MLNVEEVAALMDILERSARFGDQFANIRAQAMLRLKQLNDEHAQASQVPPPAKEPGDYSKRRA